MKLIHGIDEKRYDGIYRLFIWLLFAFMAALEAMCVWIFLDGLSEIGPRKLIAYAPLVGVFIMIPVLMNVLWLLETYRLTPRGIEIWHAFSRELIPWENCGEPGVFAVAMLRNGNIHPYLFVFVSKSIKKDIRETRINLNTCFFFRSEAKCFRLTEQRLTAFRAYCPNIVRYDWSILHERYEPAPDGAELMNPISPWRGTQEYEERQRRKKQKKAK